MFKFKVNVQTQSQYLIFKCSNPKQYLSFATGGFAPCYWHFCAHWHHGSNHTTKSVSEIASQLTDIVKANDIIRLREVDVIEESWRSVTTLVLFQDKQVNLLVRLSSDEVKFGRPLIKLQLRVYVYIYTPACVLESLLSLVLISIQDPDLLKISMFNKRRLTLDKSIFKKLFFSSMANLTVHVNLTIQRKTELSTFRTIPGLTTGYPG